jgi:hypothetical protein
MARAVGAVLEQTPDANVILRRGRIYRRRDIGVFFQVAMEDPVTGKIDLSGVTIHDPHRKDLVEIGGSNAQMRQLPEQRPQDPRGIEPSARRRWRSFTDHQPLDQRQRDLRRELCKAVARVAAQDGLGPPFGCQLAHPAPLRSRDTARAWLRPTRPAVASRR